MNPKKKLLLLSIFTLLVSIFQNSIVKAHPGRTASDGCHYCRTNCDEWGVGWNVRHCHGGGSVTTESTVNVVAPTNTPYIPPPTKTTNPSVTPSPKVNDSLYSVVGITDGDTITVNIAGVNEKIRFIGIDTPETVDPRKPVQCFGKEASSKLKELLEGKQVKLEIDESQGDRDKYNRLLRYIFLEDGTNVNELMIREGFAHEYTYNLPYKYQAEFKKAESEARNAYRGLWSENACPEPTVTGIENITPEPTIAPEAVQKNNLLQLLINFFKSIFRT